MKHRRLDLRRRLDAVTFAQAGYFTAAQARTVGYSYQAQKYHADTGSWVRARRGLFRLAGWPDEPDDEYVRATLWSRSLGVVSHDSALAVHGLSDVEPTAIHLSVPPGFRAKDPTVVTHHQTVPAADIEQRRAWQVTTPLRTLADVAADDLSQEHVNRAVSDALTRGLTTRRAVTHRASQLPDRPALRLERALTAATHVDL